MVKSRKRRIKGNPAKPLYDWDIVEPSGEDELVDSLIGIAREGDFVGLDSDEEYRKIRMRKII